jgi:hypothetical protein
MPTVFTSKLITAPLDQVWSLMRDFNGHDHWHPIVETSQIEHKLPSDQVGCVRAFKLKSGEELRERLLSLSDSETMFRYCLLDTPIPLFNYVAEVRLTPVTVTDHCFVGWRARFQAPKEEQDRLVDLVKNNVQRDGLDAIEKKVRDHAN